MGLSLITPPAAEPLSLEEAKRHLRVVQADEETDLAALIAVARRQAENYTGRAFVNQTWKLTLDRFPYGRTPLQIPRPPLVSVTTITYIDDDDVTQTWDSSLYRVLTGGTPGRIEPAYNEVYPTTQPVSEAVSITYVAGYGDAASDVPGQVAQAMRLLLGHWWENRQSVLTGTIVAEVPQSATWLLDALKVGAIPGAYQMKG